MRSCRTANLRPSTSNGSAGAGCKRLRGDCAAREHVHRRRERRSIYVLLTDKNRVKDEKEKEAENRKHHRLAGRGRVVSGVRVLVSDFKFFLVRRFASLRFLKIYPVKFMRL